MAGLSIGFIPIEGGHYYRESLEEVVRGEDLGFDSVWMEEHHSVVDHYWPSPFTVLAGFATRTSRVRLGTDIAVAPFHHPVRLAEDVTLLDVMSGGRVTLGLAIGYKPDEFALYGVELERRGARFEEQLAILTGLWTQDRVSFRGRYYTVEGRLEPRPVQRPHPPIWIAASGDAAFERAARHGDACVINPHASLPTVERQMGLYRAALAAAGKPFPAEAPIFKECSVAATREDAFRQAEPYLLQKYKAYADWGLDRPLPKEERLAVPYEELVRDRFIVGTPDECRAELERYHRVLGVNHFLLRLQWPGMPQRLVLDQIARLGERLIPALRGVRA